ncbi:YihY family inner membrane protein [Marinomonas ostreistagni]|uniref:YihY family inner membrane protein n=1 Tax=Marinomonas ostreistagni TaxID=359209 RepID=A0ABS0ZA09_9GAMM|nr:YihY family inner membrane protein [Marinomonas ostreistagni]MBJ7550486.1 YihY family inner membrane protein [Marinomonas ostreistagni]
METKAVKNIAAQGYQLLKLVWNRALRYQVSLRAAHLTLATLLAAVPIITIVFGILRLTPAMVAMQDSLISYVEAHLAPGSSSTVIPYLLSFSEQTKNLPAAGIATLILTALLLLNSFEGSVQAIWQIKQRRKIRERLLTYWAILTLGPIMLAVVMSLYGTLLSYQLTGDYIPSFLEGLFEFSSYLVYFLLLFTINFLTPNNEVKAKLTAISAMLGAVAIVILNSIFANFAQFFASYQIVYGAFAALPVFLIWLQVSWLIILLSVSLNATLHKLDRLKDHSKLE